MEKALWTLGIFLFGGWAVYLGIMVRLGKQRALLMYRGFPVLASPGSFLIAIPMGLGIVTIGLKMVFPEWNLLIPMAIFFITSVILGLWLPDWLLPMWFRWLVKNYEHVLGEMFQEAHQMGVKQWEKETRTQEGLERWADSVAQKHGWQRLDHMNKTAHAWREAAKKAGVKWSEGPPTQVEMEQQAGEDD